MSIESAIFQVISSYYSPDEYPCLNHQLKEFAIEKPFVGKRLLYAAPLTRNTLVALLPVIAGGARVTLSWPDIIEPDQEVLAFMAGLGVACYQQVPEGQTFDLIFDCCGKYTNYSATLGHIELTRSGLEKYRIQSSKVCLDVDSTLIKNFETTLGTGESLVRAMKQAGFTELAGQRVLLFGFGKVGQGICRALLDEQADVHIVELQADLPFPEHSRFVDGKNVASVVEEVQKANFVVTATGIKSVIENNYPVSEFINSPARLINMGGEDEFGDAFPGETVLNEKHTFNFILDDPTLMEFIDPIFALYNECGKLLTEQSYPVGVHQPPDQIIMPLAERFCQAQGIDLNQWV
ncbi:NAD(P)-dependent oxidoreductase [Endozoicomonas lisbonensis]|uniref:Adenosylhomocysteinase n=1 Tax=Endozoicomonas lisbonensis TaxID=3120522 RepID=A0ABV2SG67_9GAMM